MLLHPKKNKQSHIISASRYADPELGGGTLEVRTEVLTCVVYFRKPFSALAFSHDGKHLVTGEVRTYTADSARPTSPT